MRYDKFSYIGMNPMTSGPRKVKNIPNWWSGTSPKKLITKTNFFDAASFVVYFTLKLCFQAVVLIPHKNQKTVGP